MQIHDNSFDERRVRLAPALDMAAARPLAHELLAARGADLSIDASEVRHLGAQCLQVLASAALTWQADRAGFTLVDPSSAFMRDARLLGLDAIFQPCEVQ